MLQKPKQTRQQCKLGGFKFWRGNSIWNDCSWQRYECNDWQVSSDNFWNETTLWTPSGNFSRSSKWQESSKAIGFQKINFQDGYEVIWIAVSYIFHPKSWSFAGHLLVICWSFAFLAYFPFLGKIHKKGENEKGQLVFSEWEFTPHTWATPKNWSTSNNYLRANTQHQLGQISWHSWH